MTRAKLTIFRKGLLLISLPLFFQLVLLVLLLKAQSEAKAAEEWANHSRQVLAKARTALASLTECQSASRGVVLTQNATFQKEAQDAESAALQGFTELKELVADNAQQEQKASEVFDRARALITWLADERHKALTGEIEEALAQIRNLHGLELLDNVKNELESFLEEENRLNNARAHDVNSARRDQFWILLGSTFAALLVTGVAVVLFGKGIATRIAVLTDNARRLASNDPLSARLDGSDELASLDAAMHGAQERLSHAAATEAAYKSELLRRAEELAQTNEHLRQQTQENEMFVYSVSHDLRSPLVNLQGFSKELVHGSEDLKSLLSDERVPPDIRDRTTNIIKEDILTSVRFIQTAVTRSSGIIDSLLRLSRAGRIEYRPTTVAVTDVVQHVVDAMSNTIELKGAQITVHPLATVFGDPTAVEQIFGNLIGNAVNYLDPARAGRIEIGMLNEGRPDANNLRTFYVRDNGLGIPAPYLSKVFVAFQRLHGDIAKGEGIGLALVRRIIERHGGRAWVESAVNVGTTFFVALPSSASPPTPTPPVSQQSLPLSGSTPSNVPIESTS